MPTIDGLLVHPDRSTEIRSQEWTLSQLQEAVGGYAEALFLPTATAMVNEEGIRLGLEPNIAATTAALRLGWQNRLHGEALLGTVVFFAPRDGTGELSSLDPATVADIVANARQQ